MLFLIESHNPGLKTEVFLWENLLTEKYCPYKFKKCATHQIAELLMKNPNERIIPLGSIPFTNRFFQLAHNISQMNPIEIPPILRTPYFLGREYRIVPFEKIPKIGHYFIKDASEFKKMHYLGEIENFDLINCNPNHLYVVSEVLDVVSEYRVYFIQGEVYAIEYYNGNPLVFPDIKVISTANLLYSTQSDYPSSYTMDVMVTKDGTFLTEIHPVLFACGLYTTVLSQNFLHGYIDGANYVLNHNTSVVAT